LAADIYSWSAALRLVLWLGGVRYSFALVRLGWKNARVLRWFVSEQFAPRWRARLWLPIRRYRDFFRAGEFLQLLDTMESRRIRRLRTRLNKAYDGHEPAVDPLTSPRARRLQAYVVRNLFRRLLRIRLQQAHAMALANYGSAGMAARDFLNYAVEFGLSVPPALTLPLFLAEADTRHAKVSSRRGILRALEALGGLYRRAGLLRRLCAVRYGVERLLCSAYWAVQDQREMKLRAAASRTVRRGEWIAAVAPLRQMAQTDQYSLLTVFAHEMRLRAMDELLELHARMPITPETARRFATAQEALEKNIRSIEPDQETKEKRDA
jgi:hypothetical protein